jgi:hypothetical protein
VVAAAVLLFAAVAPVWATAGPTRLSDVTVSPRAGHPTTTITISVVYANRAGSPADWVRARVGGSVKTMTRVSGSDWKKGVTFRWSGKLPLGTHAISIEAQSRDHFTNAIAGGNVKITPTPAPDPTPTPAPKAAPKPTPRPTPRPTPAATSAADPVPSAGSTAGPAGVAESPGPSPEPGDLESPSPSPAPSEDAIAAVPGSTGGVSDEGGTVAVPDGSTDGSSAVDGIARGGTGQGPLEAVAGAIDLLGNGRPSLPLGLVATLATTSTAVGAALAFGLFGKRRRDGEPPDADEVLAYNAALPMSVAQVSAYLDRSGRTAPSATALEDVPTPLDGEMAMPRWRRPSLLEARRADPIRDGSSAPRLTFDHGLVGPIEGRERRLIRYSLVRLLDIPDELRGTELAFLDQGDEVQLLEKRGVYWLVLCPDGRQGWIHKMTLGDTIGQPTVTSTPTATMPIAADSWTMGDDIDGDVLAAYLESRRRM